MKRSKHSLSNYKLLTMNQGYLVPIGLVDVLPGDSFQHATSALIRTAPLLAPVMHPVHVKIHHWFVPLRIIWDDFEKFITGGPDGMDASVFPTMNSGDGTGAYAVGGVMDYLGVPPGIADLDHSALPVRALNLIFNEWYRDQDLEQPFAISKASGVDNTTLRVMPYPCWEKDYFTTARPWTQKGPEVTVPLGDEAPVVTTGADPTMSSASVTNKRIRFTDATAARLFLDDSMTGDEFVHWGNQSGLKADLANATAADINDLRRAFAIQRYEEARARYGSRYSEYLRYLGIKSSDARLQRPEYLGGGKQTIQFSEVVQTAEGDDPVGTLRGHGIGAMRSNRYRRFFEEHGFVITLMSVQPISCYMQGLSKLWNRRVKEDFFQKELQHIGQQPIHKHEVYAAATDDLDEPFGYQDRYDEYRRVENTVAGEFRTTLKFWHMGREFTGTDIILNNDFVNSNPTNRIYAAPSANQLYVMANHSIQARRLVDSSGRSFIF